MAVSNHKCLNCNAVLKFNPKTQGWTCEYCGTKFKIEDLEKNIEKYENIEVKKNSKNGLDVYRCPDCGAEIIADENTVATFCVYCKNTAIIKDKLVGNFSPDWVIPFQNTREDAVEAFKNVCKKKPLAPKLFSDSKNIDEMRGIYIPFWLFDCQSSGRILANAEIVKTWSFGDKMYTKTDTYKCVRGGSASYYKIPVDGSKNFDNNIMNSIEPFDYDKLTEFKHAYLSGFLAEKYDQDSEVCFSEAQRRAEESTVIEFKNDIIGYTSVMVSEKNILTTKTKDDYALLPVWLLNIKYKDKIYPFAMNGETGKIIGNIPIDVKKAVIIGASLFTTLTTIITVILLIIGGALK